MGAPASVFSALALVGLSFAVGTLLGMLCGYYGGILDEVVMLIADIPVSYTHLDVYKRQP